MANDAARQAEFLMKKYGLTRSQAFLRMERDRYESENAWKGVARRTPKKTA